MENTGSVEPRILNIQYRDGIDETTSVLERKYTLTCSKLYKELYLSIGLDYVNVDDFNAIYGEWKSLDSSYSLNLHCDVGYKWPEKFAGIRYEIFVNALPCILQAIKCGEKGLFQKYPDLDYSPIYVSFKSNYVEFNQKEYWNRPCDYVIKEFEVIQ